MSEKENQITRKVVENNHFITRLTTPIEWGAGKIIITILFIVLFSCYSREGKDSRLETKSDSSIKKLTDKDALDLTESGFYSFNIKNNEDGSYEVFSTSYDLIKNLNQITNLKLIDLEIWNDTSFNSNTFSVISNLININKLRIHLNPDYSKYVNGLDKLQNIKSIEIVHFTNKYIGDLNKLQNLQNLYLEIPQINEFPTKKLILRNLMSFTSSLGEISEINPEIKQMSKLKSFVLSKSKVKTVPTELFLLKDIEYLKIGGTWALDSLPQEIKNLEKLKKLDLFRNNLSYLPSEITELKNLKYLNIDNNNFTKEQVDSLRKAIPHCKIIYYPQPKIK